MHERKNNFLEMTFMSAPKEHPNPPTSILHEVEFQDMDHTLEWLLETAQHYQCREAIPLLKEVRALINRRKIAFVAKKKSSEP